MSDDVSSATPAAVNSKPVSIAILGSGFMGGTHARAFAKLPNVRIAGIWSRQLDKSRALADEVGSVAWENVHELINSPEVDAVSVTLPTFVHREFAVAVLQAGKDLLLEKPMALTLDDCDAIMAAAQASKGIFMMAHTLRFWPEYEAAVALAKSGALGKPISAVAWRHTAQAAWSPWFGDASLSGGAVVDLHIHDLDVMNWLFGVPTSVYSRGTIGLSNGYDQALTTLDYGATRCFVEGNGMMPEDYPFSTYLSIRCERGVIEYTVRAAGEQVDSANQGQNALLVHETGKSTRQLHPGVDLPAGDPYEREAAAFVAAVQTRVVPEGGQPKTGRLAVQTALAARASIERDAIVRL